MSSDKSFITIKDAAELLGVSKDTLRRWDKSGKSEGIPQERNF